MEGMTAFDVQLSFNDLSGCDKVRVRISDISGNDGDVLIWTEKCVDIHSDGIGGCVLTLYMPECVKSDIESWNGFSIDVYWVEDGKRFSLAPIVLFKEGYLEKAKKDLGDIIDIEVAT